jgi:hypothetical protein
VNASPSAEDEPWTAERLRRAWTNTTSSTSISASIPAARNLRHTYITPSEDKRRWRIQQMLIDPEEANDWVAEFDVDLATSREAGEPVLQLQNSAVWSDPGSARAPRAVFGALAENPSCAREAPDMGLRLRRLGTSLRRGRRRQHARARALPGFSGTHTACACL